MERFVFSTKDSYTEHHNKVMEDLIEGLNGVKIVKIVELPNGYDRSPDKVFVLDCDLTAATILVHMANCDLLHMPVDDEDRALKAVKSCLHILGE